MPEMSSYVGVEPRTVTPTAVAVARGTRLALNSSGLVAAAAVGVRGEYVALVDASASEPLAVASMSGGGKVPALASEAVAIGDLAYSAANGKFSKTATSAVPVGKWTQAASGDGVLGEVELSTTLATA